GRATASGVYYYGSFSEVRGAHYRGGYHGELPHILVAEIIEAVHRATRDAHQQATHVRRETASAPESGGDRSAPRWKTGANSWVTRPPSAPCSTASCSAATCSSAARGAGESKRKHRNTES